MQSKNITNPVEKYEEQMLRFVKKKVTAKKSETFNNAGQGVWKCPLCSLPTVNFGVSLGPPLSTGIVLRRVVYEHSRAMMTPILQIARPGTR